MILLKQLSVLKHVFFYANKPPTIDKVRASVNSDCNFHLLRTTFYRLLLDIVFKFQKRMKLNAVTGTDEIILWRRWYLWSVHQFRT